MKANLLLWGPPGVGKTAGVLSYARQKNLHVEVVLASIREPADFSGLPLIQDGRVHYAPLSWAMRLVDAGGGILFLDEISTAPPAVQAALLRVVLDRVVGELSLPERLAIISAANPPEMASGGWDLTPALANRFCHLEMTLDAEAWIKNYPTRFAGAQQMFPWSIPGIDQFLGLSPVDEARQDYARTLIAGFHKSAPGRLHKMPASEAERGRAWPSPRTWDMAAHAVASVLQAGARAEDALPLVSGCVGEAAGVEFITWVKNMDIPDPEDLLHKRRQLPPLNGRGDIAYVVAYGLASAMGKVLSGKYNPAQAQALFDNMWDIFLVLEKEGFRDLVIGAAKTLIAQAASANLTIPAKARTMFDKMKKVSS